MQLQPPQSQKRYTTATSPAAVSHLQFVEQADSHATNTIMAATSTSSANNSDYNLLHHRGPEINGSGGGGHYGLSTAQLQQQSSSAIVAAAAAAVARNKKLLQQQQLNSSGGLGLGLGVDDGHFYSNDPSVMLQQPLDLTHIVPPHDLKLQQQLHALFASSQQPPQLSVPAGSRSSPISSGQQYTNTLSMTRSKRHQDHHQNHHHHHRGGGGGQQMDSISSLLTNYMYGNGDDEHQLIAGYSSRLAEFYAKNPHLASTPGTPTSVKMTNGSGGTSSPNPVYSTPSRLKSSLKTRTLDKYIESTASNRVAFENGTMNFLSRRHSPPTSDGASLMTMLMNMNHLQQQQQQQANSRTASLPRRPFVAPPALSKAQRINELLLKQQQLSQAALSNQRSLSESNFLEANGADGLYSSVNQLTNSRDLILKEKREIVARLEQQNREISKEIKRLRAQQLSNRSLDVNNNNSSTGGKCSSSAVLTPMLLKKQMNSGGTTTSAYGLRGGGNYDEATMVELQTLKQRKGQLESRIQHLQSSRSELIGQLECLLKQPSTPGPSNGSLRRSLVPTVSASMAMPISMMMQQQQQPPSQYHPQQLQHNSSSPPPPLSLNFQQQHQDRSWSTPSTPAMHEMHPHHHHRQHYFNQQQQQQQPYQLQSSSNQAAPVFKHFTNGGGFSLPQSTATSLLSLSNNTVGGGSGTLLSSSQNSSATNSTRNLRNDLLIAADSVTNAMQSLVKELNSETNCNGTGTTTSSEEENESSSGGGGGVENGQSSGGYPVVFRREQLYQQQQQQNAFRNGVHLDGGMNGHQNVALANGENENEEEVEDDEDEDELFLVQSSATTTNNSQSNATGNRLQQQQPSATEPHLSTTAAANENGQDGFDDDDDLNGEHYLLNESFIDNLSAPTMTNKANRQHQQEHDEQPHEMEATYEYLAASSSNSDHWRRPEQCQKPYQKPRGVIQWHWKGRGGR